MSELSPYRVAVLQRVASASVTVDSQLISSIGKGVLVFAAVAVDDTRKEVESMAAKVLKMKLWPDETGDTVGSVPLLYLLDLALKILPEMEAECSRYQGRGIVRYADAMIN